MKWIPVIARVLLGFVFVAGGIAYFLGYANPPPDLPERLQTFNSGMAATGYFMGLVKGVEVVCGLMLLSGFFVPLALVVLAPVILNIFLVHAFMAPEGVPLALILGALEIYLAFFSKYRGPILALFRPK